MELKIYVNKINVEINNDNDNNRKLKKLWNMKVMIILIVIGAFGTVTKGLLKGLEDLDQSHNKRMQQISTKGV